MNKTKHIDVITKYFYPVSAGIETNILETYSVMAANGWDVTIHTTASTLDTHNILPHKDEYRGLNIVRYPVGIFGFYPKINYKLVKMICLHNFNIFPHILIMLKAIYHKFTNQKHYGLYLTPHGGMTPEWPTFTLIVRIIKQLYHRLIGLPLTNYIVDGIRAISNWEYRELQSIGVKSTLMTQIDNGLDPLARTDHAGSTSSTIKQIANKYSPYILSIGRISPIKNYETSIRALSLSKTNLKLLILGPVENKEYEKELQTLISSLNLDDRVIFMGVVNGHDKYYLFQQALVFIHMAMWESFCNVAYEAMSLGKLCIVADNTALTALTDDGKLGILTPTFDSQKLSHFLNQLSQKDVQPQYRQIISRLKSKQFPSWADTASKMANIYQKITKKYE